MAVGYISTCAITVVSSSDEQEELITSGDRTVIAHVDIYPTAIQ
jgi:hypothetical protein